MKLLEWNIHKMTNNIPVKPFVYNRILGQEADIICLVEYIDDMGIKNKLNEGYWISESIASSGNQILIAINKKIAPNGIELVRDIEEDLCYNFLHISFTNSSDKKISVIGVRMLSPINATLQTEALKNYLSKIKETFICTGDFNIKRHRMNYWFPKYNIGNLNYDNEEINNSSIIYVEKDTKIINGFGDVDHVLASHDLQVELKYEWDFINDDDEYPQKSNLRKGELWDIKPAYPDHAMLIAEIDIIY